MAMVGKQAMVLVASAFLSVALTSCASYKPAPKVFHEATIQGAQPECAERLTSVYPSCLVPVAEIIATLMQECETALARRWRIRYARPDAQFFGQETTPR